MTKIAQQNFQPQSKSNKNAFEEFGNQFLDNNSDLLYFGANAFASKEQITFLNEIKVAGKQEFKEHWNKIVINNTFAITDTIKNNKFEIFSTSKSKNPSKLHQQLKFTVTEKDILECIFT